MQGILSIFQGIVNSSYLDVDIFLKSLKAHQSFRYNESNNSVVQSITSLLSQSSTRYTGLLVLSEFLKQASLGVIEQKGALWITLCIKACNPREQSLCNSLAYDVLGQIIEKSVDIPDLSKAISSHLLNKIFETLNSITSNSYLPVLKMIEKCLKLYSGPCSQFRVTIEKLIYSLIDNRNEQIVKLCGKCLHLLQQTRGSGMHGISYKTAWQTYQLKLLGTLHESLEMLFVNCSEVYDENIETERLQISPLELSNEPICRSSQLFTRIKNLMIYLEIAIKEPFSVSKCIMPKKIFNLISKILAINCKILEKNSISDNLAVGALLPELHIRCFKLINVMVLTLQTHLAMYYKTILNFVMETLKWTSFGKTIGFCKPYNSLRIAAYQTLSLWCETMKNGSECQLIEEKLFEEIIFDMTPFQNELTLKVLSGAKKHMSKKARRLLHKAQNEQTHLIQAHAKSVNPQFTKREYSDEGNETVCVAALNCLKCVFMSSSHSLKPVLIKLIQDKVLELCIQLSSKSNENRKSLYSNSSCRRKLYCILYSFITSSHHLCPPPAQLIITLINHAQINDDCKLIREDCNFYMRNLELIIHPHKDNLNFPYEMNEIQKVLKIHEHRRSISSNESDHDDMISENSIQLVMSENEDNENVNDNSCKHVNKKDNSKSISLLNSDITNEIDLTEDENVNRNEEISNLFETRENDFKINDLNTKEKNADEYKKGRKLEPQNVCTQMNYENGNIFNEIIDLDEEPSTKKMRFEKEVEENVKESEENNTLVEEVTQSNSEEKYDEFSEKSPEENEDNLVDEIAKTFINELNDESD